MARQTPSPLALWGVVAAMTAALVALAAALAPAPRFHGTTYTELLPAEAFSLVDHDGRAVTLESYRGTPVLLFFGFTRCPDVCPLTLSRLSAAVEAAGRSARDTRILLVTVDPEHDTPEVLRAYAARFGPRVTGLTGGPAALEAARRGYGAYVLEAPPAPAAAHEGHGPTDAASGAEARTIHSAVVYGIDRRGLLQVVISESAPAAQLAADVRTLSRR
jgi:protein SCO1